MTFKLQDMSLLETVVQDTIDSLNSLQTTAATSLMPLALDALQSTHAVRAKLQQLILKTTDARVQDQMLVHDNYNHK